MKEKSSYKKITYILIYDYKIKKIKKKGLTDTFMIYFDKFFMEKEKILLIFFYCFLYFS